MWVNNLAKQPRIINNKFNAKSLGAQLAPHGVSPLPHCNYWIIMQIFVGSKLNSWPFEWRTEDYNFKIKEQFSTSSNFQINPGDWSIANWAW